MAKVKAPNPFHHSHPFCSIHIWASYKIKGKLPKKWNYKESTWAGGQILVQSNLNNLNCSCNRTRQNVKTSNERSKAVSSSLNTQWATVQCSETLAALSVHYNEPVWPDMANWGLANFHHKPFHGNVLINTVTSDCVFAEGTQWVGQLKNNAIETWKTFNYRTEKREHFHETEGER